jgi:hypothetical protein
MTVIIKTRQEWDRILAAKPFPLYVTSDKQWFTSGFGITYVFETRHEVR